MPDPNLLPPPDLDFDACTPFRPRQAKREGRTCRVGLSGCLISPYGVVYPCIELRSRHTLANLPECLACPINVYCEGRCAGLAWKEHGDLYGAHTLACQQAQARCAVEQADRQSPQTPHSV